MDDIKILSTAYATYRMECNYPWLDFKLTPEIVKSFKKNQVMKAANFTYNFILPEIISTIKVVFNETSCTISIILVDFIAYFSFSFNYIYSLKLNWIY